MQAYPIAHAGRIRICEPKMMDILSRTWDQIVVLLSNWRVIGAWIVRHALILLSILVVVLLLSEGWNWFDRLRTVHLTILSGPGGTDVAIKAAKLQNQLERESATLLSRKYEVTVEPTDGFNENAQRVGEDQNGTLVGICMDGFGASDGTRIILPLSNLYLHILCRNEFLKGLIDSKTLENDPDPDKPYELESLVKSLKPGRVWFGPEGSGSRQMAEIIFGQYGMSAEKWHAAPFTSMHDVRWCKPEGHRLGKCA